MRQVLILTIVATLEATATAAAADYMVDPVHSSVSFKISHAGISMVHGRFNELAGKVTVDKDDAAKSSFKLAIKVASVDTNNKKRDDHLRSPDFFNAKQFPAITFKSTAVRAVKDGYEVTGDLTMHGVTKPITFTLKGGKTVEFPPGTPRIGFTTDLTLKRSNFDMGKFTNMLGDEIHISIGLEAFKAKQ